MNNQSPPHEQWYYDRPPTHITIDEQWYDDPPQIPGYYWFYGDPHMGSMGGHYSGTVKPDYRLCLVEVFAISNGVLGVSNGQFIPLNKWNIESKTQGVVGKWAQAKIPTIPNEESNGNTDSTRTD